TINSLWHWLQGGPGRRLYRSDRDHFYQHIRQMGELFHGQADDTMLNGEPLAFMRLGRYLERAGQTARLMDVHYHTFPDDGPIDDPVRLAQWWALLACCSATEPFQKRSFGTPNARDVVSFLLFEPDLPRSVSHCLRSARHSLVHVRGFGSNRIGMVSTALLEALLSHVALREGHVLVGDELHDELTYLVDSVTDLCTSVEQEFFQSTELQTRILAEASSAAAQQ
ncbi:MAG TPA: alpha-E domain-containing protein, partial [Polyangiales bacterium]|nr:alpha-E domain-containing protein [Polyangiales bacterium]